MKPESEDFEFWKPTIQIEKPYSLRNKSDSTLILQWTGLASAKAASKSTKFSRSKTAGRIQAQSSSHKQLPLQSNKHDELLQSAAAKKQRSDTGEIINLIMARN